MTIDRAVMLFAGCIVLLGVILTYFVNIGWLLLPAFVGLNLVQSSFTGFCPAAILLKKLGLKKGPAFDP